MEARIGSDILLRAGSRHRLLSHSEKQKDEGEWIGSEN